jgi:hypothetical protein
MSAKGTALSAPPYTFGAREKYTVRVHNEKQVDSIRVEGEFPKELNAYDLEFKPGWNIDFKKNDAGKIVGATWRGTVHPYEFVEFGMLGINPKEGQAKELTRSGARRIYTITITCTNDTNKQSSTQTVTVLVPHDQGQ